MHSIHSLAHRAPPATRRVRWQPYNALPSSISSRSPSLAYLSTPANSVSSSPSPPKPTPLCEPERLKAHPSMPQTPRDPPNNVRDPKNKYATGLVDQAVKSLCEIWRPQDIPTVFLTSSRATVGSCNDPPPPPPKSRRRNTQLPSPVSPLTQPSPFSPPSSSSLACARTGQTPLQCEPDLASGFNRSNLVPIKGFVHEVLRRSRTSGSVLQTALCYLEAIRPRVPELIRKEQAGEGAELDSECRVMPATPAELELEAQLSALDFDFATADSRGSEDVMDTVRVYDEDIASTATPSLISSSQWEDKATLGNLLNSANASLSPLPSPLLCPRRAFLASLILASKFTQDKCYSNRAWAKLSGLPAREIGRCERALGDALDWRLWVGKTPVASEAAASSTPTPAPATTGRPVVRCHSEPTFACGTGSFLVRDDRKECVNVLKPSSSSSSSPPTRPATRGLRRSSTLPAEAFTKRDSAPSASSGYEPNRRVERHQLSFSNIAQQDQLMGSPELSEDSLSTPGSAYSSQQYPSPIPSTPSLTFSPTSTESSSGDRTIQMSSFTDDNMTALSNDVVIGNEVSSHWCASHSPTLSGLAFEAALQTDRGYATSAFLGVPPRSTSSIPGVWPWSEPADDDVPAPQKYGFGSAEAAHGFPAKMAELPAFALGPELGAVVFPERACAPDRPYPVYHSHMH
ncbi:hypothetical protein B0H15DRAFT_522011 [Mycena belliarum]|uniref:G1/S-specific cyclin pas1 n=1 Tax=Mycena belliarum TaxID=1033014 RepID=A0AAD6TTH6_9AGAR|nr:hypothetical protein B0H15DRAFT_522011 [Mycena belliae]